MYVARPQYPFEPFPSRLWIVQPAHLERPECPFVLLHLAQPVVLHFRLAELLYVDASRYLEHFKKQEKAQDKKTHLTFKLLRVYATIMSALSTI